MDAEKMSTKKKYEILMVGKSGVGKTSLSKRYTDGKFDPNLRMTMLVDTMQKEVNVCGEDIKLRIQDSTGHPEKYAFSLNTYFRSADGIIFVLDVTDRNSLEKLMSWFPDFNQHAKEDARIMVVGNKTDEAESRKVSVEEGRRYAEEIGATYMETSAKDNDNIKIAFEFLAQQIFLISESWQSLKSNTLSEMHRNCLPNFEIILIGSQAVGKTSFLNRYLGDGFFNPEATLGVGMREKSFTIGNSSVKFYIFDTAGMERFQCLSSKYYRKAAGAVLVYDVTWEESFTKLEFWLDEINQHCKEGVKKIIVGNKTDMESRAVSEESAKKFAQSKNIAYLETSVKHNDNVGIAFEHVVQQVLLDPALWKRLYPGAEQPLSLSAKEPEEKKWCSWC